MRGGGEPVPSSRVPLALFSFTVRLETVSPTPGMPWKLIEPTAPSTAIHERVSVPVAGAGAGADGDRERERAVVDLEVDAVRVADGEVRGSRARA